ncbi:MAG TPA: hypothetical protein VL461_12925 [Dictyobacter sp.]|jgi:uncharacterized membrane protein|nr:hypothetical protein [Dictyobacter sp.]
MQSMDRNEIADAKMPQGTYDTEYIPDPQMFEQPYYQQHINGPQPFTPNGPGTGTGQPPHGVNIPYQDGEWVWMARDTNSDGRVLAAFSYLGGWFTGLVMLLFVRDNRFVRFHALQSVLFFGGVTLFNIFCFSVLKEYSFFFDSFIHIIATLAVLIIDSMAAIGWFVGIVCALGGRTTRLPFVGDIADQAAGPHQGAGIVK